MVDYFRIINKYYRPGSEAHRIYTVHVTMVTCLALKIAKRHGLSGYDMQFIEEASMLHDIGIFKTYAPQIECYGTLPYIQHVIEGRRILEEEGLPLHAKVAANHIGVGGLSAKDIREGNLDLPEEDIKCKSKAEKIISYADLFYSKNPRKLWTPKSYSDILNKLEGREKQLRRFKKWYLKYGV